MKIIQNHEKGLESAYWLPTPALGQCLLIIRHYTSANTLFLRQYYKTSHIQKTRTVGGVSLNSHVILILVKIFENLHVHILDHLVYRVLDDSI